MSSAPYHNGTIVTSTNGSGAASGTGAEATSTKSAAYTGAASVNGVSGAVVAAFAAAAYML
jgi:hypothetical protein